MYYITNIDLFIKSFRGNFISFMKIFYDFFKVWLSTISFEFKISFLTNNDKYWDWYELSLYFFKLQILFIMFTENFIFRVLFIQYEFIQIIFIYFLFYHALMKIDLTLLDPVLDLKWFKKTNNLMLIFMFCI